MRLVEPGLPLDTVTSLEWSLAVAVVGSLAFAVVEDRVGLTTRRLLVTGLVVKRTTGLEQSPEH